MGLLKVFGKKSTSIPEKLNNDPVISESGLNNLPAAEKTEFFPGNASIGLDAIYRFFQDDYESRGYNDALANPDESYKADNIRLFRHDLLILIERSLNYYEGFIKEIDFHIGSRTRAGLIDLVEELKIRKEIVIDLLVKIKTIKEEATTGKGPVERIALSYQRGFMRGLSAISQSRMFNRNL